MGPRDDTGLLMMRFRNGSDDGVLTERGGEGYAAAGLVDDFQSSIVDAGYGDEDGADGDLM